MSQEGSPDRRADANVRIAPPGGTELPLVPSVAGPERTSHRRGALFWLTAAGGWAVIGYGLRGLFHHRIDTRPANLAKFAIGGALVHDLVFAPVVLLLGVLLTRALGRRWRGIIQAALIVSGCLALFSYPLVRGFGHANHNPTSEPYNYTTNLAIVLGVVWAAATVALLLRWRGIGLRSGRHGEAANRVAGPDVAAPVAPAVAPGNVKDR